jgi:hypothetical protein
MKAAGFAVSVAILLALVHPVAQSAGSFSGTFTSHGAKFAVTGGVAFTGTSSFDQQTPVIQVPA